MTEAEKNALTKHYAELRNEMSADVKQLSERSQIKTLETTKLALERKLQKIQEDNRTMEKRLAEEKHSVDLIISEGKDIKAEIRSFESQDTKCDRAYADTSHSVDHFFFQINFCSVPAGFWTTFKNLWSRMRN